MISCNSTAPNGTPHQPYQLLGVGPNRWASPADPDRAIADAPARYREMDPSVDN